MSALDGQAEIWERLLLGVVAHSPQRSSEVWRGFDAAHILTDHLRQAWVLLEPRSEPMPPLELAARLAITEEHLARLLPMHPGPVDVGQTSLRISSYHVLRKAVECARQTNAVGTAVEEGDWEAVTAVVRREHSRWRTLLDGLPMEESSHGTSVARWLRSLGGRAAAPEEAYLSTGLERLDDLSGGLRPGHLIFVAGRPGMGKTFFLLWLCRVALLSGRPVIFLSLEMLDEELIERMTAVDANVPLKRLRQAVLSEAECDAVAASVRRQADWPISIQSPKGTSHDEVINRIRRAASGLDKPLVCVDYLQLVSVAGSGKTSVMAHK